MYSEEVYLHENILPLFEELNFVVSDKKYQGNTTILTLVIYHKSVQMND